MPEKPRQVMVYSGPDDSQEVYTNIHAILSKILDDKKYEIHQLKHSQLIAGPTKSWASQIDALIVNNDGGHEKFDSQVQKAFVEYFLNSGKLVFLCNAADGRNALWILKAAAEGEHAEPFPENVGVAFEKFAHHQPVPANVQAFQVHKGGDQGTLVDYAVGLVRGQSDLSYMYFVCEDGDTAIFVVAPGPGPAVEFGKTQVKTDAFWRDILRVLRLIGVETLPISPVQAAKKWADSNAPGDDTTPAPVPKHAQKIYIYLGPGEEQTSAHRFEEFANTLKRLIIREKHEIQPLKHQHLIGSTEWQKECAVLFVDNGDWERRFDDSTRNTLRDYFASSGKVVFFCDPQEGRKAMWLLKMASAPNEEWPDAVGKAYERFAQNQPVPTDLHAVQMQKEGDRKFTDLSLGLIKSSSGAFTYLKCEDGDTAVFVAMTMEEVLKRGQFIWTELLRVVNLPSAAWQMPPSPWGGPNPVIGELTKIVKYVNTGAAAAASSLVSGLQDIASKFLKTDESKTMRKPPNLLIYTHPDQSKNFEILSNTIREFLAPDRYTIYQLKKDHITNDQRIPWSSNCQVLFVDNEKLDDQVVKSAFVDYFLNYDGKLVLFNDPRDGRLSLWLLQLASENAQWADHVSESYERFVRTGERVIPTEMGKVTLRGHEEEPCIDLLGGQRGAPPVLHFKTGKQQSHGPEAVFVGQQLHTVCLEKGEDVWTDILGSVGLDLTKGSQQKPQITGPPVAGVFFKDEKTAATFATSHPTGTIELTTIKALIGQEPSTDPDHKFNKDEYFQNLHTKRLGQVVVFAPVVPSTMPISDDWHSKLGTDDYVIITKQQTQGQGRSGNQWLSPPGSALFSFSIRVQQNTILGKHLSFLQHLVTLAAADSIRNLHEGLNIRIKWPNDIYYGNDTKIGGVLVKANFVKDQFVVFVGTGINVANQAPTVCINQFLPSNAKPLTPECVIAITLTRLEQLIDEFQSKGAQSILPLYYKYWLHSNQEVTVATSGEKVTILGLDEFGFLSVKAKDTGRQFTLHPDGNSFDMMANLIEGKETTTKSN